jgi:hypothetical protein
VKEPSLVAHLPSMPGASLARALLEGTICLKIFVGARPVVAGGCWDLHIFVCWKVGKIIVA